MDICGNSIHAGDAVRQQIKYPISTLGSVSVAPVNAIQVRVDS